MRMTALVGREESVNSLRTSGQRSPATVIHAGSAAQSELPTNIRATSSQPVDGNISGHRLVMMICLYCARSSGHAPIYSGGADGSADSAAVAQDFSTPPRWPPPYRLSTAVTLAIER